MELPDSISPITPPPPEAGTLSSPPPEDPAWNLVDVLAITFLWLVAVAALSLLVGIVIGLHAGKKVESESAALAVPLQTAAYLLMVAFMAQIVRMKHGGTFLHAVSWNAPRANTALLALGGGIGLALFSQVFTALLSRWSPKSVPIDRYFRDTNSAYLLAFFGIFVAPFVEELFFRGFLYPALARRIGIGASVVLTALPFALMHSAQLAHAWVPLLWLFVVGIVLTLVRARTKSVATSVLIHLSYNATIFFAVFLVTHGFRHMERA